MNFLSRFFDFSGQIDKKKYQSNLLWALLISLIFTIPRAAFLALEYFNNDFSIPQEFRLFDSFISYDPSLWTYLLLSPLSLASIIIVIFVFFVLTAGSNARRLHDLGLSGYIGLFFYIPILGLLLLLPLVFNSNDSSNNQKISAQTNSKSKNNINNFFSGLDIQESKIRQYLLVSTLLYFIFFILIFQDKQVGIFQNEKYSIGDFFIYSFFSNLSVILIMLIAFSFFLFLKKQELFKIAIITPLLSLIGYYAIFRELAPFYNNPNHYFPVPIIYLAIGLIFIIISYLIIKSEWALKLFKLEDHHDQRFFAGFALVLFAFSVSWLILLLSNLESYYLYNNELPSLVFNISFSLSLIVKVGFILLICNIDNSQNSPRLSQKLAIILFLLVVSTLPTIKILNRSISDNNESFIGVMVNLPDSIVVQVWLGSLLVIFAILIYSLINRFFKFSTKTKLKNYT